MEYGIASLVLVGFCLYISIQIDKEGKTFFEYLVNANTLFCIQYLFLSAIFIVLEKYAVYKPLASMFCLDVVVCGFIVYKRKTLKIKKAIKIIKKSEILVLASILALIPLISTTAEDIGTTSDQGAYFFHTMVLMEGKESMIHTLQENTEISDAVKEGLEELQEELIIYYHEEGENYYYPHALRTWCTFPALFGRIFGRWENLKAINYIFILLIFNLFFIGKKVAINKYSPYLAVVLFAMSPLILYIGKAGVTEIVLLFLFVSGLYYMLNNSNISFILSGISIGLAGFVHISLYVYLPIITAIIMIKSLDDKKYKYINIIQLVLYICSIWYAYKISPIYTELQYQRIVFGGSIQYTTLFLCISIGIIAVILFQIFVNKMPWVYRIKEFIYKHFKKICLIVIAIVVVRTVYYMYILGFTDYFAIADGVEAGSWNMRSNYINQGLASISHLNIINVARATGICGLVLFLLLPFIKKNLSKMTKNLYFCGLYASLIFFVLQMDTPFNYYASRYFAPFFVPIIVLTLMSSINKTKWLICLSLIACIYNSQYWPPFITGAPQLGQYAMLQAAMATIPNKAIVFCNPESGFVNTHLTSNLRVLNNNQVYNLKNFDEVDEFYSAEDKYIISGSPVEIENAEKILENIYTSQYSFGNGSNGTYAKDNGAYDNPFYIYRVASD